MSVSNAQLSVLICNEVQHAEDNNTYKKFFRSTFAKCQVIWKSSCSAAETRHDIVWVDGDLTKPDKEKFHFHVSGAPGASHQREGEMYYITCATTSICQSEYRVLKHYQRKRISVILILCT